VLQKNGWEGGVCTQKMRGDGKGCGLERVSKEGSHGTLVQSMGSDRKKNLKDALQSKPREKREHLSPGKGKTIRRKEEPFLGARPSGAKR